MPYRTLPNIPAPAPAQSSKPRASSGAARQAAIEAAMAESEAAPSLAEVQSKGEKKESSKGKEIQRTATIDAPPPKASDSIMSFGSDDDALFASIDLNLECYGDVTYVSAHFHSLSSIPVSIFLTSLLF